MVSFPDQHLGVSTPCITRPRTLERHLLSFSFSVIEVNIGIVCSCLLSFPAFLDRHSHVFGSLLSRLKSLTPSWHLRKDHVFDRSKMSLSSRANRSDELGLDEYTALKGENDKIERHRTFDVTVSNNDVDRLPGASEPTTFASPEYLPRQSQAYV